MTLLEARAARTAGLLFCVGVVLIAEPAAGGDFSFYGSQVSGGGSWGLIEFDTDPITGESTRIGAGGLMFDFDFSPSGELFSPRGDDLWKVDLETGKQTKIGDFGIAPIITSIAFGPGGRLYGTDNEALETSLYRIDPDTAAAVRIGRVGEFVFGLDFGPDGTLYGASGEVFTIDLQTGVLDEYLFDFGPFITALDYGTDGVLRGIETDFDTFDSLWEIDLEALTQTKIATCDEEEVWALASVPAPGTVAVAALAVLGTSRRRRRAQ
jgi:hypothetical protein